MEPIHGRHLFFIIGIVGLWWTASTVTTIVSKSVMSRDDKDRAGGGWTDTMWVDLTATQHLLRALTTLLWLKARKKTVWPDAARDHKKTICITALGNLDGNMATNAACTHLLQYTSVGHGSTEGC